MKRDLVQYPQMPGNHLNYNERSLTKEQKSSHFGNIHYTGQFLLTRDTFRKMLNAYNKGKFRNEHATKIDRYQEARNFLCSFTLEGKFPSLKTLQARKAELLELKNTINGIEEYEKNERTISIAAQNVHSILAGIVQWKEFPQYTEKDSRLYRVVTNTKD